MITQEEKDLVFLILSGDKGALNQLYHQLYPRLTRYIKQQVKSAPDREEICQDCFINFIDALPLFSFKSSLWTFLVSITKHEIADYYRKQYAKKTIKALPLLGNLYDQKLQTSTQTAIQLHQAIEQVYLRLHPAQARILQLKYQEKQSIKQIAKVLEISTKAAESKLYRARLAFQETYLTLYGEPGQILS